MLYSSTTTALKETPNDKFTLTRGVLQGGPEFPMLYNLYMDFVIRVYLEKCKEKNIKFLRLDYKIPESASSTGRTATGDFVLDLCEYAYADDLVLTFDGEKSLQKVSQFLMKCLQDLD